MANKRSWKKMSDAQKKAHIRSGRARGLSDQKIGESVDATKGMIVGYRHTHMPELTNLSPDQVKAMSSPKRPTTARLPESLPQGVPAELVPQVPEVAKPEPPPRPVVKPVSSQTLPTTETPAIEPSSVALPPGSMRTGVPLKDVESHVRVPSGKYPPAAGSETTQCTKRIDGWQCGREAVPGTKPLRCFMHPIEND